MVPLLVIRLESSNQGKRALYLLYMLVCLEIFIQVQDLEQNEVRMRNSRSYSY